MIRHVVMWQLHDPGCACLFRDELMICAGVVPGTLSFCVGVRGEGLSASCDVCLVADFVDAAALRAYEEHPVHRQVSARLGPLRSARHVMDFRVAGAA